MLTALPSADVAVTAEDVPPSNSPLSSVESRGDAVASPK
jgi:hypothetical protein